MRSNIRSAVFQNLTDSVAKPAHTASKTALDSHRCTLRAMRREVLADEGELPPMELSRGEAAFVYGLIVGGTVLVVVAIWWAFR